MGLARPSGNGLISFASVSPSCQFMGRMTIGMLSSLSLKTRGYTFAISMIHSSKGIETVMSSSGNENDFIA